MRGAPSDMRAHRATDVRILDRRTRRPNRRPDGSRRPDGLVPGGLKASGYHAYDAVAGLIHPVTFTVIVEQSPSIVR